MDDMTNDDKLPAYIKEMLDALKKGGRFAITFPRQMGKTYVNKLWNERFKNKDLQ